MTIPVLSGIFVSSCFKMSAIGLAGAAGVVAFPGLEGFGLAGVTIALIIWIGWKFIQTLKEQLKVANMDRAKMQDRYEEQHLAVMQSFRSAMEAHGRALESIANALEKTNNNAKDR